LKEDPDAYGAHFKAAAALLRAHGVKAIVALCAARTTHDDTEDAKGKRHDTLDDFIP
jgi:hypothetical protein